MSMNEISGVGAINPKGQVWLFLWASERPQEMTAVSIQNDNITILGDPNISRRYPQQVILATRTANKATIAFIDDDNNLVDAIELPCLADNSPLGFDD